VLKKRRCTPKTMEQGTMQPELQTGGDGVGERHCSLGGRRKEGGEGAKMEKKAVVAATEQEKGTPVPLGLTCPDLGFKVAQGERKGKYGG
jgi:hypothetical protein